MEIPGHSYSFENERQMYKMIYRGCDLNVLCSMFALKTSINMITKVVHPGAHM